MDNECGVQAIIANEITERFTLCPTGLSLSLSLSLAFTFKQSISFSNLLTNNLSIYLIYLQTYFISFTHKYIIFLSYLQTFFHFLSFTFKHSVSNLLKNILYLSIICSQIFYLQHILSLSHLLTNFLSLSFCLIQNRWCQTHVLILVGRAKKMRKIEKNEKDREIDR